MHLCNYNREGGIVNEGLGHAKHKKISHAFVPLKNIRKLFRLQAFEVFGGLLRI